MMRSRVPQPLLIADRQTAGAAVDWPSRRRTFVFHPSTTIFSGAGDGDGQWPEMSLREPAWRAPSRPCPFYQRGNCIFAAKCNFLHVLPQDKSEVGQSIKAFHKPKDSVDYDRRPPILRVDSPASIRSPPHEPQMQRLLSALTDVIGDEQEMDSDEEETLTEPDEGDSWSAGLPTLVHGADATFFARVNDTMAELMQMTDGEEQDDDDIPSQHHRSQHDDTLPLPTESTTEYPNTPSIHTNEGSPEAQYVEIPPPGLPENHDDLLSPVNLSALHLTTFGHFSLEEDTMSIDSGFEEAWKPPPKRASTFDLLRSPFGSPSSRLHSPRFSTLLTPASNLKPLEQPSSLEDDLDSPSDRISAPIVAEDNEPPEPECEPTPASTTSLAYMLSPEPIPAGYGESDSEADRSDDGLSYMSEWEPATVQEAVYVGANSPGLVAMEGVQELERQDSQSLDGGTDAADYSWVSEEAQVDQDEPHDHQPIQPFDEEAAEAEAYIWDDAEVQTSVHDTMSSDALNEEIRRSVPAPPVDPVDSPNVQGAPFDAAEVEDRAIDLTETFPQHSDDRTEDPIDFTETSVTPTPPFPETLPTPEPPVSADALRASPGERDSGLLETPVPTQASLLSSPELGLGSPERSIPVDMPLPSPSEPSFTSPEPSVPVEEPPLSPPETSFDDPERSPPLEGPLFSRPEPSFKSPGRPMSPEESLSPARESPFYSPDRPHLEDLQPTPVEESFPSPLEDSSDPPGRPVPTEALPCSPLKHDLESVESQQSYAPEEGPAAFIDDVQPSPEVEDDTAIHYTDTLHSLYDIYTDVNEEASIRSNSPVASPTARSPVESIQSPPQQEVASPAPQSPTASLGIRSPAEPRHPLSIDEVVSPEPLPPAAPLGTRSPLAEIARPLRERVFTPPSQLGRSRTLSTASSSPVNSMDSGSKGRESPASVASSSKTSHHNIGEEIDSQEASKKVPFGFRSQRHSARPSLVLNHGRSLSRLGRSPVDSNGEEKVVSPPPSSTCSTGALRPLRLSVLLNNQSNSIQSLSNVNIRPPHSATASLSSVPSRHSLLDSHSLSSAPATANSYHIRHPSAHIIASTSRPQRSPSLLTDDLQHLATFGSPLSAPAAAQAHPSWPSAPPQVSHFQELRSASRLSEPIYEQEHEGEDEGGNVDDTYQQNSREEPTRRSLVDPQALQQRLPSHLPSRPSSPLHVPHHHHPRSVTAPVSRSESVVREPLHSIATPKPTLMFAIASDDVSEVRRVLENGEANPNDAVGPQSALQFALTNDQLTNRLDIVKTLLAFGADPSHLKKQPAVGGGSRSGSRAGNRRDLEGGHGEGKEGSSGDGRSPGAVQEDVAKTLMDEMDPATRYYVQRADATHTRKTSKLIHRSFFRPLTRVRYDLVGQDRALEELFKLLSIHSRQISAAPVVVMFSGPSGHGKSLLARKFGSLLDVPTHTVNMVTVRSQDDLWESYSINIHEEPTNCTLAEFLVNNEGKRCVVVLDEIEKVDNEKVLWSLLMPWESGRCSFEAKSRHVDTRNVIWLCTSNIGQSLIFDHWTARENQDEILSREEFLELVALLRPRVSERLGASVLSRITSVLPFVPFTPEEKRAVCAEAVYQLGGEDALALSRDTVDQLIESALGQYIPQEGARSLHRAVSNQLVDVI